MRMTDAKMNYVLDVDRLGADPLPRGIPLVIGGDVEELLDSDDIRIQCWDGSAIVPTEKEISYLRLLSPQKPQ